MALTLIFASEGHNRRRRRRKQRFAIPHIFWPICGPQEASQQTPVCYDLPLNELQILSRKSEKNASNFFFLFSLWRTPEVVPRIGFINDDRAAKIGWINTYAAGGLRSGFNNDTWNGMFWCSLSQPLQTMSFEVWELKVQYEGMIRNQC